MLRAGGNQAHARLLTHAGAVTLRPHTAGDAGALIQRLTRRTLPAARARPRLGDSIRKAAGACGARGNERTGRIARGGTTGAPGVAALTGPAAFARATDGLLIQACLAMVGVAVGV